MHQPNVAIILLNYNGSNDTIECIKSLMAISYKNINIVIVDNLSPDNSFNTLKQYFSNVDYNFNHFNSVDACMNSPSNKRYYVTLIQAGTNNGFGHGNNIGIRYALKNNADYVLILNNDTIVSPSFLEPLVDICENDSNVALATGKIYFYDRPNTIWYAGGGFNSITGKVSHDFYGEIDSQQSVTREVGFTTGCLWLVPRETFLKVGMINEDYFMYVEDLEFCYRIKRLGLLIYYCNDSIIYHHVSASTGGQLSEFSVYWMAKNKMRFIWDNLPTVYKISSTTYHTLYVTFWWIYKKRLDLCTAHIKGILGFIRNDI